MQIAQAGADLSALATPPYAGGTPDGSIRSTPQQATADLLNSGERRKGLEKREGDVNADKAVRDADILQRQAAESQQQTQDFSAAKTQRLAELAAKDAQQDAAYQKFKGAAGSLKDPSDQFWEDKGTGSRILSGLAAFASGLGAGWNGSGENPYLNHLNKEIQGNYEAHKQNIQDLYQSSVEAGKIADTAENHAKFDLDARQASYGLARAAIKDQLMANGARAQSPLAKLLAQKTVEDINKQQVQEREEQANREAAAAAAKLAQQRAQQEKIRLEFKDAYDKNLTAGYGEEEARANATKAVHALGYNASETAPIFAANGVTANPATGEPVFPESKIPKGGPSEPTFDAAGKLQIPAVDPNTGKPLKLEERQKLTEDAQKRTVIVDGKPALAVNDEAAKQFKLFSDAEPEAARLTKELRDAWAKGDKGRYDQARNEYIEIAPKLYGFTRGPSSAQAGESGGDHGGDPKGTVAGQIPEFESSVIPFTSGYANRHPVGENITQDPKTGEYIYPKTNSNTSRGIAIAKLNALESTLQNLSKTARENTFLSPPVTATKAPATTAALAASLGLVKK